MGITNFILSVCRNWNTGENASNEHRVEYTPQKNRNKFNLNKLNDIEKELIKSLKGNTNFKRTFSGTRLSNNPEEVIQTSNFFKNNTNTLKDWEKISLNNLVLKYALKKNIGKNIGKTKKLQNKNKFNKMIGITKKLQNNYI